jgi:hypothetical protein
MRPRLKASGRAFERTGHDPTGPGFTIPCAEEDPSSPAVHSQDGGAVAHPIVRERGCSDNQRAGDDDRDQLLAHGFHAPQRGRWALRRTPSIVQTLNPRVMGPELGVPD